MTKLTCFKAYDIRGRLGEELNEEIAWRIGRAYGEFLKPKSIVLGGDVRLTSETLKLALAKGLQDAGVDVLDIGMSGTEEIYFATFHLDIDGGIEVTASHNPPEYNGYKVYWEDGAQVTAPIDKDIITEVQSIKDYHTVKTMSREDAVAAGLYEVIGKEIDDKYMAELKKQIIHPDVIREMADDIKSKCIKQHKLREAIDEIVADLEGV